MKKLIRVAIFCVIASSTVLVVAAQQSNAGQSTAQQGTATPKAQPSPMPQEKAMHPAPSNNAQQKTQKNSVGWGALTMTTAQPVDFWQEQVAYTGGNTVTTDFLYNPNVGVIYGYRENDFKCANGEPAHGGILEAQYTQATKRRGRWGQAGMPSNWMQGSVRQKSQASMDAGSMRTAIPLSAGSQQSTAKPAMLIS